MTTWTARPIGDVAAIRSGGTPLRTRPEYWTSKDVPWVTTSEVTGGRIRTTAQYLSNSGLENSSAKVFPSGTVLIAMYGQGRTRGKVSLLEIDAATNQACAALIPKDGALHSEYAYQVLGNAYDDLRALSNDGGQKNLSAGIIANFRIPIPPLPEQRRIAEILRAWDDAIAMSAARIAEKNELHRGLISGLIAVSHHTRAIPLARIVRPITLKNAVGESRVLTSSAQRGLVSQQDYFTKNIASSDVSGYYLLEHGDFAYNRSSSNGFPYGAIRRLEDHPRGVISTLYLCFRVSDPETARPEYLAHLFRSGVLDKQLALVTHEGARNHGLLNVAKADFFELTVPIPSVARQAAITDALDASAEELELLNTELELLRTQKRGLMQKLLTGEIRVGTDEVVGRQ